MAKIGMPLVPACATAQTDGTGLAVVQIKVPGNFNGIDGYAGIAVNGRYLWTAKIWLDDGGLAGDRVTKIELQDIDGVIPEASRSVFPAYPVIAKFYDSELAETADSKQGLWLEKDGTLQVGNMDGIPSFAASGLWIVGNLQGAGATAGRTVRVNYYWSVSGLK